MGKKKEKILNLFLIIVIIGLLICALRFNCIGSDGQKSDFISFNCGGKTDIVQSFKSNITKKQVIHNNQKYNVLLEKLNVDSMTKNCIIFYRDFIDNYALNNKDEEYSVELKGKLYDSSYDDEELERSALLTKLDNLVIEDKKNNKKYDLADIINDNFMYSFVCVHTGKINNYSGIGLFRYKNDLYLEIEPYSNSKYINEASLIGARNRDGVQELLKAQNEKVFINLDKEKVYKRSNIDEIKKIRNPYRQVLDKNNIHYLYCGINNNSNNNQYQLKMNSSYNNEKKSFFKETIYKDFDRLAVEINKDNFKGAIELMTGIKDISFKGIVIDKKYSIDNKKHIINTEEEFKRYMK